MTALIDRIINSEYSHIQQIYLWIELCVITLKEG